MDSTKVLTSLCQVWSSIIESLVLPKLTNLIIGNNTFNNLASIHFSMLVL